MKNIQDNTISPIRTNAGTNSNCPTANENDEGTTSENSTMRARLDRPNSVNADLYEALDEQSKAIISFSFHLDYLLKEIHRYEALRSLEARIRDLYNPVGDAVVEAKAALAKARGEA